MTATIEQKIGALCAHHEMIHNTINQSRLQLRTWDKCIPWLDQSMDGDLQPLLGTFLQEQARAVAVWDPETRLGEAFRLERFGDMETLFQMMSEPLPMAEEAPFRPELEQAGDNES